MIKAVISTGPLDKWIADAVEKFMVDVKILDARPYGEEGVQNLVEIKSKGADYEEILNFLRNREDIDEVQVEPVKVNKFIGVVKVKKCNGSKVFLESNCFIISSQVTNYAGRREWRLVARSRQDLQCLLRDLDKHNVKPTLKSLTNLKEDGRLTQRQELIIKTAFERGYYDFPKKINVKRLAEIFEVSTATLSEIIRHGQKKIIEYHFGM
jgi:predicted DNA binding protein